MSLTTRILQRSYSRRSLLQGVLAISLSSILLACGNDQPTNPLPSVTLDTFPTGVGRGFPIATLEGTDNSNTGINKGDIAPNFRLQLADGQGLYLSDLAGRPVLINFWATWCGPCRLEMPEIVQHAKNNNDLIVIAINVEETEETVAAFANDFDMIMPVARDINGEIRDLYQVRGMPTSVFIERSGKVSTYREGILSPSRLDELLTAIL